MLFVPYIIFPGNAEEALEFYGRIFEAEEATDIMRYSDSDGMPLPEGYDNKVLHAELVFGENLLYISDAFPEDEVTYSNGITLNLGPDSEEEINRLFKELSEGGEIVQPLKKEFWGAIYGSVKDKFGIHWSLNYQIPKTEE